LILKVRNIRTKTRPLTTGGIRGGIPFERGALFYLLRNRFYIGEVRYKGESPARRATTDSWSALYSMRSSRSSRNLLPRSIDAPEPKTT
jgi:hypothetical protein